MKAITTKYFGPGNVRGSRMKATAEGGNTVTISYDHGLNLDDNHAKAAQALCKKLNWKGEMIGGHLERGMAWVFVKLSQHINTPRQKPSFWRKSTEENGPTPADAVTGSAKTPK